jgi:hypothetical protein
MIRFTSLLFILLVPVSIVGCTVDHVKQGFYEGFRVRNDLQTSPQERLGKPESPNYQQYEQLKKEQLR